MLIVKHKKELYKIKEDEILFILQRGKNIEIKTKDKTYIAKGKKLSEVEGFLDKRFFKCHTYLIVNSDNVKAVTEHEAVFENGENIGMCYAATCRLKKEIQNSLKFVEK